MLEASTFGYISLHLICTLKEGDEIDLDILTPNTVIRFFFEGELVRTNETKDRLKSYFKTYIVEDDKIERNIKRL